VAARYGRDFLQAPNIVIQVKESAARRIVMDGQLSRSGVYPVGVGSTLIESIAQAGGFNEIGDPTKVFIYRTVDGRRYVAKYDVTEIRDGKRSDPRVFGGDKVVVFSSNVQVGWRNVKDALGVARNVTTGGIPIK